MTYTPNPHPQVFPKLIGLWNESPQAFYAYLRRFWIYGNDADTYMHLAHEWAKSVEYREWLNAE